MKIPFTNVELKFTSGSNRPVDHTTSQLLRGSTWYPVKEAEVENTAFIKKEQVEIELPVKAGRSSVPDGIGLLAFLYNEFATISPEFNIEFLKAMEYLAMYNADFSLAVENIVTLGNTDFTVHFDDSVPPELAKEMNLRLKTKGRTWYNFSEGVYSLVNDLLAQTAISGALSAEIVPDNGLTGVSKVVLVAPKNIRFRYDPDLDRYKPYQQLKGTLNVKNVAGLKELTETTYKYFTLRRFNENPYGIPPMLACLENITIEKDMICNMQNVIKKLGVLGFLSVLLNKPAMLPGELPIAYQARCMSYLQAVAPEIDKSMAKGFVVGFKDTHEFQMDGILQNVSGAKDIIQINNETKFAGMKQDALMMGRSYKTTETLGRVILAKLSTQVVNYQKLVAAFLREIFLMDLALGGYPIANLDVEFEKPMIGDKSKDEEATNKRINNFVTLRDEGIIDQDQLAQSLGYEKPAAPGPIYDKTLTGSEPIVAAQDPQGTKKTDPAASTSNVKELVAAFEVEFRIELPQFNYTSDIACGCTEHHETFAKQPKDISRYELKYRKETGIKYRAAIDNVTKQVGASLSKLGQGASLEQVTDNIFYTLYKSWKGSFTEPQKAIIKKNIKEAYVFFRKDKAPLGKGAKVPEATFGVTDTRTMEYFMSSDELYLGKFITDSDTRTALTDFIKEQYIDKGIPLGSDEGLDAFKEKFGKLLEGEEWKLDRIISTTVNKMRNYATVNYMQQAEIETFEIVGINDRLQCPYCSFMQGKTFTVSTAADKVAEYVKSDPSTVKYESPFITSVYKKPEDMKDLTGAELQAAGIDLPPYHCSCRDVIVAVFE